jgi:hypothetical protein
VLRRKLRFRYEQISVQVLKQVLLTFGRSVQFGKTKIDGTQEETVMFTVCRCRFNLFKTCKHVCSRLSLWWILSLVPVPRFLLV